MNINSIHFQQDRTLQGKRGTNLMNGPPSPYVGTEKQGKRSVELLQSRIVELGLLDESSGCKRSLALIFAQPRMPA